jgi:hypothetical protein
MEIVQKTNSQNLLFLDGLRGLAAFYVMVGHARWLLWEGYGEGFQQHPGSYSIVNKVLMYFFSLFKYGLHFIVERPFLGRATRGSKDLFHAS